MHQIQEKLLKLSKKKNLAKLSLRAMAAAIDMENESPQKIKHHLLQLEKKGFLTIDRHKGTMGKSNSVPGWAKGLLVSKTQLYSIPIIGTANCGPATIFAEQNFEGFLRITKKLIGRSKPDGLYAIKASGSSMNRAEVNGKQIEDGDYIIVDSKDSTPRTGNVVLALIDNMATVKKYIEDLGNEQIVLMAESSHDYQPIHLHQDDNFIISGKVIDVVKKPRI